MLGGAWGPGSHDENDYALRWWGYGKVSTKMTMYDMSIFEISFPVLSLGVGGVGVGG